MRPGLFLIRAYLDAYRKTSELLAHKLRRNFYLYLAALFSLAVVLDVFVFHQIVDMRQRAYDLVIKNRFITPKRDASIVIVDINEKSLADMAPEYGRWPWPRQVLGEFLEQVQEQRPKAVVFDILFSDPDVYNPDSDAYLDGVIAATDNTFFPLLRLPEDHDKLSQVEPGKISGVKPAPGQPQQDVTVAVVLPFLKAALASGRLGTINISPDQDGIVRSYRMVHEVGGWLIPSLPVRIGEVLGWKLPQRQDILLNWRGKPFTYTNVSFSDVYFDMLSKDRKRSQDEFKDKIVIIGSTAPGLFDVKPTSMAKQFPGVEILATAIDNVKHDDYIRVPQSRIPALIAALLILWATALGFYKDVEAERFAKAFGLSQAGLLVVSYLSINLTNFYLNLTGPVFVGFIYFSIAKIYQLATARALERNLLAESLKGTGGQVATMAVFHVRGRDDTTSAVFMRALKRAVERSGTAPKDVEILRGKQRGLFGLFDTTLVVSWLYPRDDEEQHQAVEKEASDLLAAMPNLIEANRIGGETLEEVALHRLALGGSGTVTAAEWRHLFAETLARVAPASRLYRTTEDTVDTEEKRNAIS
jgi:CHASE2 domain-containing sensor protein